MISCHSVDATNYTSLRSPLVNTDRKPLLITAGGLPMVLPQSGKGELFQNIHRLLLESGGRWTTTNSGMIQGQNECLSPSVIRIFLMIH